MTTSKTPPIVIAVDGPVASGKTTVTRRLARAFGVPFLDSGLLYRAVAARLMEEQAATSPEAAIAAARAISLQDTERDDLRAEGVGKTASEVAAIPAVRDALTPFLRRFCEAPEGGALCGRDTASVICPEAPFKFYITASAEIRADRRFAELRARGDAVNFTTVLDDVRLRDERDRSRAIAPLVVAPGAVVIDTSRMTADAAFEAASQMVRAKLASGT